MGRPAISNPMSINLGEQQAKVDEYAKRHGLNRAAAVRELIAIGVDHYSENFTSYTEAAERLSTHQAWREIYEIAAEGHADHTHYGVTMAWWDVFERYEDLTSTKEVHIRLGNPPDEMPVEPTWGRPLSVVIRGLIHLGYEAEERQVEAAADNYANAETIKQYRNGEHDAPIDDIDYYVDDHDDPPPDVLEMLEYESTLPPGL